MFRWLIVITVLFTTPVFSQNLQTDILSATFPECTKEKGSEKKRFEFAHKAAYYNPLNYLGAGLLFVYQKIISEQFQATCTYEISCSEYTRLSIRKSGFFKGTLMGLNQLSECIKSAKYEHPRMFLNNENKIINHIETAGK